MSFNENYLNPMLKKQKEENEKIKQQTNETIDKSAAAQAGIYEQAIEQAPLESRALYDQNAIDEAVNRKKIQETLANMGMTDSGLSSSMNTALAVQKSRADNAVRVDEHQRIQAYQSAIDQIFANAEAQKATESINLDRAAIESATEAATSMYNTDVEATQKATQMSLEYQDNRAKMAQGYIQKGVNVNEAWAQAYAAYPDNSTAEGIRYAYYGKLRNQGYSSKCANAMSNAYINSIAAGYSSDKVYAAVMSAAIAELETEIRTAGINLHSTENDRYNGAPVSVDKIKNTMQAYETAGISDVAVAYAIGYTYMNRVLNGDDTTADQVGQALAQCFSGVCLEIAMMAAGIEREG